MGYNTRKAHLLANGRICVERVVIPVEAIEECSARRGLELARHIGGLVLRGWVRRHFRAFGPMPVPLADKEGATHNPGVDLAAHAVDQLALRFDNRAGPPFVVYTKDAAAHLEAATLGARGDLLEERDVPLAINRLGRVELGDPGNRRGFLRGYEIDDFLRRALEGFGGVSWVKGHRGASVSTHGG